MSEVDEEAWPCGRRCSHGGCCQLDQGHEGLHDTGYCTYSDAEALTNEAGDALYLSKVPDQEGALVMQQLFEGIKPDA